MALLQARAALARAEYPFYPEISREGAAAYGKTPSLNFFNKDRQLALACAGSPQRVFRLTAKGRYRSGQTGQTVNLLALRLRWFESSPAQILRVRHIGSRGSTADCSESAGLALRSKSAETADSTALVFGYAACCSVPSSLATFAAAAVSPATVAAASAAATGRS